ncbi:hypothetical protein D3C75_722430 [compost metagenome]
MVIQVVLGQVGKQCGAEPCFLDPAQIQGMAGGFHEAVLHPFISHPPQALLQLQRLPGIGGGGGIRGFADPHLDIAHQTGDIPPVGKNFFHNIGGGGFAVGSRYSDHLQPGAGITVEAGGNGRQGVPRILDHQHGHCKRQRLLYHKGACAGLHRCGGVLVSVRYQTSHAYEQITRLHLAGIRLNALNLHTGVANQPVYGK